MSTSDSVTLYLEEYKAYIGDLGNIGSRYATVQGFYMSVISALLGILALAETTKVFGQVKAGTLVVVCLFSMALCGVWFETTRFYQSLFAAKFAVLRDLEKNLPYRCYEEELKELKKARLLKVERWVPLILSLFFLALIVIRLRQ